MCVFDAVEFSVSTLFISINAQEENEVAGTQTTHARECDRTVHVKTGRILIMMCVRGNEETIETKQKTETVLRFTFDRQWVRRHRVVRGPLSQECPTWRPGRY